MQLLQTILFFIYLTFVLSSPRNLNV